MGTVRVERAEDSVNLLFVDATHSHMCVLRTDAEAETPILWPPDVKN